MVSMLTWHLSRCPSTVFFFHRQDPQTATCCATMTLLHNRFTDEHEKDTVLMSEVTSASGKGEAASAGDRRGCGIIRLKFYVSVDE